MRSVVYVSCADSGELHVLGIDAASGQLTPLQVVAPGGVVMPIAIGPDRRFLYLARRNEPFAVLAYAISPGDGRLSPIGSAPLPASMAYLSVDASGRWLFGASYADGLVSVSPIGTDGVPRAACQVLPTGPRAHAIRTSADNRSAIAAVLGAGRLLHWRFDAVTGALSAPASVAATIRAGAGPRHLVFHPQRPHLYVINELDASVDVFDLDRERGTLVHRQTVSTLPPHFDAEPWAAELRITPDGRWLYTSERRSSTLAGFAIAADGRLGGLGHWPTQAQPRGMAVDPSGRLLIVAGQLSHRIGVHRIDPASGMLSVIGESPVGLNPTWAECGGSL